MINSNFVREFLKDTDDTGRFVVTSLRTGKRYFVEVIETAHTPKWGSIDPATGNLMHKKGDGKYRGGISPEESMITPENGFSNITMCGIGTSPHAYIEMLDAKYPDKEVA
jgi:hypothetical protein